MEIKGIKEFVVERNLQKASLVVTKRRWDGGILLGNMCLSGGYSGS